MEPAAIMPSTAVFRGAVALMAVSLAAAVWHVVAWPQFPAPEPLALAPLATRTPFAAIAPPVATATAQGATAVATTTPGAATPTPTPRPGRRYVIESGDTLSGIAADMGTTVEAITAANGITTDTLLRIGQELIIP
jgi:nucleoid-associated protein YgaU